MNKDCIFCKIVRGEVPSTKIKETEDVLVFLDIYPKAENHLIIIPKKHIDGFHLIGDFEIWEKIGRVVKEIVDQENPGSFRIVVNGKGAALIAHLHLHLLWPVEHTREI